MLASPNILLLPL